MNRVAVCPVLCLAACASEPERELAPGYLQSTFTPPFSVLGEWSHVADGGDGRATRGQHLTRHGRTLDRVWILSGVRPGQRIVEASVNTEDGPEWSASNLKGLAEGSLWALGYGGVDWQDAPVAGQGERGRLVALKVLPIAHLTIAAPCARAARVTSSTWWSGSQRRASMRRAPRPTP